MDLWTDVNKLANVPISLAILWVLWQTIQEKSKKKSSSTVNGAHLTKCPVGADNVHMELVVEALKQQTVILNRLADMQQKQGDAILELLIIHRREGGQK